jgi:hypothetical protein
MQPLLSSLGLNDVVIMAHIDDCLFYMNSYLTSSPGLLLKRVGHTLVWAKHELIYCLSLKWVRCWFWAIYACLHITYFISNFSLFLTSPHIESDTFNLFLIANYVRKKWNLILLSLSFCDRECEREERKKQKTKFETFSLVLMNYYDIYMAFI